MNNQEKQQAILKARNFSCPRYDELPDMGLYLEQTLSIVKDIIKPISTITEKDLLTGAMLNHYIKNKALMPAVNKKYYREHLCYIIIISILKPVFSVGQIAKMFEVQRQTYDLETAYNYFCSEFENALKECFDFTGTPLPSLETKRTQQTILIRAIVLAVSNRIYVEKTTL